MTRLMIGTAKGAWVLQGDRAAGWQVSAPLFPGWSVTAFGPAGDGSWLAATGSGWFGPGLHRSHDLVTWTAVEEGPAHPPGGPALEQVWTLTGAPGGRLYAGVAEAGVFTSDDHGHTWQPLTAFNDHPTRDEWQPGAGGMCAHTLLFDGPRMWIAASAIGLFRSDDHGATLQPCNDGVEGAVPGGTPGIGYCVHRVVADPARPDHLWRQDHTGVYRSSDAGDRWERIERGLPARFGFPIVRDAASGHLFVVPLAADSDRTPVDGRFAAWRSTDDGDTWHRSGTGWPEQPTWTTVLRGAMVGDGDGGVYLGTTGGEVWATHDAGDRWYRLPGTYPRIGTVAVV